MTPDPQTFLSAPRSPFMVASGLTLQKVTTDEVVGLLDLDLDHHTPWGVVHGGVFTSAVESVASVGASFAVADRGQYAVGLANSTDFLRPVVTGVLDVIGSALMQGRTQQLWQVVITKGDGKMVARGQLRLQNVALTRNDDSGQ